MKVLLSHPLGKTGNFIKTDVLNIGFEQSLNITKFPHKIVFSDDFELYIDNREELYLLDRFISKLYSKSLIII